MQSEVGPFALQLAHLSLGNPYLSPGFLEYPIGFTRQR